MARFETTIDIDAPPDAVWAVLADIPRWPEWAPTVTEAEALDPGSLAVGQRYRLRQPRLGDAEWQVTAVEAGRGFTWVRRQPLVTVTADHRVAPRDGGSSVTLVVEFTGAIGGLVARLTRDMNQDYMRREAEGLKARSEGKAPPDTAGGE